MIINVEARASAIALVRSPNSWLRSRSYNAYLTAIHLYNNSILTSEEVLDIIKPMDPPSIVSKIIGGKITYSEWFSILTQLYNLQLINLGQIRQAIGNEPKRSIVEPSM